MNVYAEKNTTDKSRSIADNVSGGRGTAFVGGKVIQGKLNAASEKIFRGWVRDKMPTLPEEVVADLVKSSDPKRHIDAIRAAKEVAVKMESEALRRGDKSSSAAHASRSLAAELFDSYSPKDHHYVLLGNSPAMLRSALTEAGCSFSDLPLGGLTDAKAQTIYFGKDLKLGTEREVYGKEYDTNKKLQIYLLTYLRGIKERQLVVIDFTQSGLSPIIAADLLTKASNGEKLVKLFTFSNALPNEDSALTKQKDYDVTSAAPLGPHERAFVTMTDMKAYKDQMNLKAYKSLTLEVLKNMEDPEYGAVLENLRDKEGAEKIDAV